MLADFIHRARALFRRARVEHELDDELRFHLERQTEKLVRTGIPPPEAARRARIALGGTDQVKEAARDSWGVRLIQSTAQDIVYALRVLRKSWGFAGAVVISLALGIGANTAVFTLMDAVMWRMLPIKNPESLLVAGRVEGARVSTGFTYQEYRTMRDRVADVDLAGYASAPVNLTIDGPPEPGVRAQLVTGTYFTLLGVSPILGRAIGPEDDRAPNAHPVAMLSYDYWQRRFARDPAVIGKTIRLSAAPFAIIGIAPPGFSGAQAGTAADLFLPIMMQPTVMPAFENLLDKPIIFRWWVQALARTKAGVTPPQAAARLDAIVQNMQESDGTMKGGPPTPVVLNQAADVSDLRRQFAQPLLVLLAMVGVVLLTACANVANLLLARAASRRSEFAMRLALGAGRARLMRQMLAESLVLALLGGIGGVLLARWGTGLQVMYLSSGRTPIAVDIAPNPRILLFTAAISLLTGILFGFAPAWRAARLDLTPALRNVRASVTRGLQPGRLLAIAQLALALPLLVGAGVFVRSLQKLGGDDAGDVRQSVLILRVEPKGSDQRGIPGTSERLDRTYRSLIQRIQAIPRVRIASMANSTPTAPVSSAKADVRIGQGERIRVPDLMAYPNYFATLDIPIVRGREFTEADLNPSAPAVCIVNEAFVRRVLPNEDPIGKTCAWKNRPGATSAEVPYTVVGVIKESRYSSPTGPPQPLIYTTFLQTSTGRGQMVLHARIAGSAADILPVIRREVAAVDPTVPMFDIHTLAEEMNAALMQQRLIALLSTFFGALALVLACVGLYGLVAFTSAQRTAEMGIRIALGARRGNVVWLVVSEALRLVAIGILIGIPASFAAARLASDKIAGLVFGLEATDPGAIAGASCILVGVAVLAAWLPARRASRVDPNVALRTE
jgi:predicted permease